MQLNSNCNPELACYHIYITYAGQCKNWSWIKLPRQLFPGACAHPVPTWSTSPVQSQRLPPPPLPHSVKLHLPPPRSTTSAAAQSSSLQLGGGLLLPHTLDYCCHCGWTDYCAHGNYWGLCTRGTARWAQIRLLRLFPGGMFTREFTPPAWREFTQYKPFYLFPNIWVHLSIWVSRDKTANAHFKLIQMSGKKLQTIRSIWSLHNVLKQQLWYLQD